MSEMRSCKERLQKLRKQFEISKKEYGQVQKINGPLPEIHLHESKKIKKQEKKAAAKQYYRLVNWYLNEYLKPKYKQKIYDKFDDFDEMCAYVYDEAVDYLRNCTYDPDDRMSWDEWADDYAARQLTIRENENDFTRLGADDRAPGHVVSYIQSKTTIPEGYWKAYGEYCKKHPIKSVKDIPIRRRKFIKKMNKSYKKIGKHRGGALSPWWMYSGLKIDKDRMVKNLKKIVKNNLKRNEQMKEELEKMWEHCEISPEFKKKLAKHTKEVRRESEKRLNQMIRDLELNPDALPDEPIFYS